MNERGTLAQKVVSSHAGKLANAMKAFDIGVHLRQRREPPWLLE
jgi:hypothetical protein